MTATSDNAPISRNRKALHDYEILEKVEAGIELKGGEVKSIREGRLNMSDAYAAVTGQELFLRNLHITPYKMYTGEPLDPIRPRKLLLHKKEITKLAVKVEQKGLSILPLSIYFKGRRVKVELGVGVGRKKYDKREAIAEADAKRRMAQATRKDAKER